MFWTMLLRGYTGIRKLLLKSIKDKLASLKEKEEGRLHVTRVVFTGHSLGGALATLAAVDTNLVKEILPNHDAEIECHTFGAPHVGGVSFEKHFNQIFTNPKCCTRFTNALDIVPNLLTLINLSEHFPGVPAGQVFLVSEKFQHAPATTHILGGAVDVSIDIINGIINNSTNIGASGRNGFRESVIEALK